MVHIVLCNYTEKKRNYENNDQTGLTVNIYIKRDVSERLRSCDVSQSTP